ncbi:MAG: B12-binding domain-containing radical SAM protein [Firmicutes bacterium]|nr:B12-binding domain-containing radical SAM protein [Bacillota bacterium]
MKTLITTLNAKYIHTSLAIRLLYVASYKEHDIDFKEYTIKDDLERVAKDIIEHNYDIVALSTYIWNVEHHKKLCALLKKMNPEIILILGGPEVTYEPAHFIEEFEIDYCMSGEGEQTFPQLLSQIENHEEIHVQGVSYKGNISNEVSCCDLRYVESLDSPYNLAEDEKDKGKRLLYFETSRGCPFQCQYCLSSLEHGLRFFSEEYLKKQLDIICHSKAKTIKILDRSFNADAKHAIKILDYIFKNYSEGQQYQFEINADVLQQSIIEFIRDNAPKGVLRFEVGIQSTYEPTNKAVKRIQNFKRLSEVVRELMTFENCDLHLDLIAGLPFETYERFQQSFDEVFAFHAKELQLGFLKLLRGTSLRTNAEDYGYIYQENSPYEMIKNKWMDEEDIKNIHIAEDMLEKYWNSGRFKKSLPEIMKNYSSAFQFFYQLGLYYNSRYPAIGYQLHDLFECLDTYTNYEYHDLLIQDYFPLHKTKPKRWYKPKLSKPRNEIIPELAQRYNLDVNLLFRYALIEEIDDQYMIIIYKDMRCRIEYYPK